MGIEKEVLPILIVALLTWGGVFLYLLRLDNLTRELEKSIHHKDTKDTETAQRMEKREQPSSAL
jgi:predicted DNA repair protein MutK